MKAHPCGAPGWDDGNEFTCDLPSTHEGPHVDLYEGWEWSRAS